MSISSGASACIEMMVACEPYSWAAPLIWAEW